jgi:hypothetical protein
MSEAKVTVHQKMNLPTIVMFRAPVANSGLPVVSGFVFLCAKDTTFIVTLPQFGFAV